MEKDLANTTVPGRRADAAGIAAAPLLRDLLALPLACGTGGSHQKNACRIRPQPGDRVSGARLRAFLLSAAQLAERMPRPVPNARASPAPAWPPSSGAQKTALCADE
ncbi:hypothetical protein [Paracoccus sp. MKU1]|uniref:hypothetical protein n=1 Tax=Paracoccus sp. MKU1 TaxID=1745182 RepID=UPI00128EC7B6|nr:hypothetical protein [Paracoccus sp. MKU1]